MHAPSKVLDLELTSASRSIEGDRHHLKVDALIRWKGIPIGNIRAPLVQGFCDPVELRKAAIEKYAWPLMTGMIQNQLIHHGWVAGDTLKSISDPAQELLYEEQSPRVTVCVCTRDRTEDLTLCLEAIAKLDYPSFEVLVIDNAPSGTSTRDLVQRCFPKFRYVCEPRPGLDWARNRAIIESKGEILAYADDDVVVDRLWLRGIVSGFAEGDHVMAVTGLVLPFELETKAQTMFEANGGFARGCRRMRIKFQSDDPWRWARIGTGQYGTGANMAYRRCLFDDVGPFDTALDVGTVTNGGGDLEMFFRTLKFGHTLVYEPRAMVRHRHRRDDKGLARQIHANGLGMASYVRRSLKNFPEERYGFCRISTWYLFKWGVKRTIRFSLFPAGIPASLPWSEVTGFVKGWFRYPVARKTADALEMAYAKEPVLEESGFTPRTATAPVSLGQAIAVKYLNLESPLEPIGDVMEYRTTRVFVALGSTLFGYVDIDNQRNPISVVQLAEHIADSFGMRLLSAGRTCDEGEVWQESLEHLKRSFIQIEESKSMAQSDRLNPSVSVSIVIGTYDRPDDLRECLDSLVAQDTTRKVEIIVVDNNPDSGLTKAVVDEFEDVILINEKRQGSSYARNSGICASSGAIVVTTDDDVIAPPQWLEELLAPFTQDDVMVVTGNVLPFKLDHESERLFEFYGGLGRGFRSFDVGYDWYQSFRFRPVPTWTLGATANSAFRSSIFNHPKIGLMPEYLGAGVPAAVGEDTYMFYKVLHAGYRLSYAPSAFVWHKHRSSMKALRKQIYCYSKGHVGYNLATFLEFRDSRGLLGAFWHVPKWQLRQLIKHCFRLMRGRLRSPVHETTFSMTLIEILGSTLGPIALLRSWLRVRRTGRSKMYVPVQYRVSNPEFLGESVEQGVAER